MQHQSFFLLPLSTVARRTCRLIIAARSGNLVSAMNLLSRPRLSLRSLSLLGRRRWVWLILLVALALRWNAWSKTINEDEAFFFVETLPYYVNPTLAATGASPHGYFTSHLLFGLGEWLVGLGDMRAVRAPFLLLGLAACLFGWRLGRRLRDWPAALALALALALWPYKAYWDVEVRYYGVMMSLAVGAWWLLERWRREPRWGTFLSAVAVTWLAALTQIIALVLLAGPWFYLGWIATAGFWRARRAGSRTWAIRCAGWLIVLLFATLAALWLNRGPDWFARRLGMEQAPAWLRPAPPEGFVMQVDLDRGEPHTPRPGEAIAWTLKSAGAAFAPQGWNAPALFGLADQPRAFWELIAGIGGEYEPAPGSLPHLLLLAGLLLGTAGLFWRSPPLALTLWVCLLASNVLLDANRHMYQVVTRYYTLQALIVVVIIAAGVPLALRPLRWPLFRWRPRLNARVTVTAGLVLAVVAVAALQGITRARAGYFIQDWKSLYRDASARFPGGAFHLGMAAHTQRLYNDLAVGAEEIGTPEEAWRSPRLHRVIEAYHHPSIRGRALLDRLNPFEGLVFFNPIYWTEDFNPLTPDLPLDAPEPRTWHGVHGSFVPVGYRCFVMRGAMALPLLPRFLEEDATTTRPATYALEVYCEVPGVYELSVGGTGAAGLIEALADELVLPLADGPASATLAANLEPVVSSLDPLDHLYTPEDYDPRALDPRFLPDYGKPAPFPVELAPARESAVLLATPPGPFQPFALRLRYDGSPLAAAPIVRLRYVTAWTPATYTFDAGTPTIRETDAAFHIAMPLRVAQAPAEAMQLSLTLIETGATSPVMRSDLTLHDRQRPLHPGDLLAPPALEIPRERARALLDRPLRLLLTVQLAQPSRQLPSRPDLIVDQSRRAGSGVWLATYLRFTEEDGSIRLMTGQPAQ